MSFIGKIVTLLLLKYFSKQPDEWAVHKKIKLLTSWYNGHKEEPQKFKHIQFVMGAQHVLYN